MRDTTEVLMKSTKARAAGLLAAGAITGGILAGTLSANAATGDSSTDAATTASTAPAAARGSAPVRSDESAVGDSLAAALTEKAEAKTGGSVVRVETDAGDAAYEAHVQKTDGTVVTVKFDSDGNITAVENGMGLGDPAPSGAPAAVGG
jgi:spermidine/putrescine-binding protein